jgi:hypothetical protein
LIIFSKQNPGDIVVFGMVRMCNNNNNGNSHEWRDIEASKVAVVGIFHQSGELGVARQRMGAASAFLIFPSAGWRTS